jgi:hypothetical protein
VERVRVGATLEERATEKAYLPTGEVGAIVRRARNNATAPVVRRWIRYDTLGRMTANGDANTSAGFVEVQPWLRRELPVRRGGARAHGGPLAVHRRSPALFIAYTRYVRGL